jgi:hypothetical protein
VALDSDSGPLAQEVKEPLQEALVSELLQVVKEQLQEVKEQLQVELEVLELLQVSVKEPLLED